MLSLVMVMLSLVVVVVDIRQVRDPCRYQWGKDGRGRGERFREQRVRQVAAQQGRCYYYRPLFRLSKQGLGVSAGSNGGLEGAEQLKTK